MQMSFACRTSACFSSMLDEQARLFFKRARETSALEEKAPRMSAGTLICHFRALLKHLYLHRALWQFLLNLI